MGNATADKPIRKEGYRKFIQVAFGRRLPVVTNRDERLVLGWVIYVGIVSRKKSVFRPNTSVYVIDAVSLPIV